MLSKNCFSKSVSGSALSPLAMKAKMFLNMRLAAPEAGTIFSVVPPCNRNSFHLPM